jgi:hypothetical protein
MHRICTKYARNICTNMQIYAIYMQKYANICSTVCATEICKNMQKYAKYMHAICKNMQNMQSRFLYAEYAKICTPHFADAFCPRGFDRAVMVVKWYGLPLVPRETRVRTLPWASSGHETTRTRSPLRRRSPMLTFATKMLSTGAQWTKGGN